MELLIKYPRFKNMFNILTNILALTGLLTLLFLGWRLFQHSVQYVKGLRKVKSTKNFKEIKLKE